MATFDTVLPADSIEFCPTHTDMFVCGTYHLQPATKKRTGQCLVFRVKDGTTLENIQSIHLPAIPDMKWCHRPQDAPLLGIADSEGHISLHQWKESKLESHSSISCASSDVLCLSLDWSNRLNASSDASIVASLSDGSLCLLRPSEGAPSGLVLSDKWAAHDFEPWIAAWDYWNASTIYSGGDDLKLKMWDTRQGFDQPVLTNKRFDAGVTTIQSSPHSEHLVAVGSYDEKVRIFDKRQLLSPISEINVGGGVWRIKWHPSATRRNDILVACMHDGFKVVRLGVTGDGGDIIKRFDQHESLAYGADWSFADSANGNDTLIASCSFYDHSLHLWSG
ncbi:WD-REPEATS-REGION domain-containing protein [Mycena kentingensis (nom. inval.)]|nr:WD-REPEATS-REGION domain-containing protein [Mycena kentingensis (nom. inval.)]